MRHHATAIVGWLVFVAVPVGSRGGAATSSFSVLWNAQYPGGPGPGSGNGFPSGHFPPSCRGAGGGGGGSSSPGLNLSAFGITVNAGEKSNGAAITLFDQNDFGLYPTFAADGEPVNGGVPQRSNLTAHKERIRTQLHAVLPAGFSGLGVFDFEGWHPAWEYTNNTVHRPYVNASLAIVSARHPGWTAAQVAAEAAVQWEAAAKAFLLATLAGAR